MLLTIKEKLVLRALSAGINSDYSINQIAEQCDLSPNGAYKLLKKLEKEGILKVKLIANIKSYKLNFDDEKTERILALALMPYGLDERVKNRAQDLKALKDVTAACILFGSYITSKQKPNDLDVLFMLEKKNFNPYKKTLAKVQDIMPVKIHDVIQTRDDLTQNLKKNDPIVTQAMLKGRVLWGFDALVEGIKNAAKD